MGEREYLSDDVAPSKACLHDHLEAMFFRASLGELFFHQFGKADDDGKDVVEVVGDAAGEPAEGFHLVCLTELLFDSCPLGHFRCKLLIRLAQLRCSFLHEQLPN